jgi:hypothetical protein
VNILLIAPNMQSINAIPEIRTITALHKTHVLNGNVSVQDIYAAVSNNEYDVLHFATHIHGDTARLDEMLLSNDETLDLNSATRFARLANARLVMFNICLASRFATYMVRNRIPCVVYTTVAIEDRSAWELPCAFYEQVKRSEKLGGTVDFKSIFDSVDDGDGTYGILYSADFYVSLIQMAMSPMWEALEQIKKQTDKIANELSTLTKKVDYLEKRVDGAPVKERSTWMTMLIVVVIGVMVAGNLIIVLNAVANMLR